MDSSFVSFVDDNLASGLRVLYVRIEPCRFIRHRIELYRATWLVFVDSAGV